MDSFFVGKLGSGFSGGPVLVFEACFLGDIELNDASLVDGQDDLAESEGGGSAPDLFNP
jgi:hypothetical protein